MIEIIRKKWGIYEKYQGTTMTLKSVAEQANVTQGTVYYHFRTKENLMLEAVRHVCDSSWANVKNNQRPPTEKLKSAKARTKENAYYHRLILTLTF